jgi:hypothetical protein
MVTAPALVATILLVMRNGHSAQFAADQTGVARRTCSDIAKKGGVQTSKGRPKILSAVNRRCAQH